ncbi:unnamed protein product [Amoebophrya sp. A120]|nr:unnamed protein product [Amoebophrya sp. A120]|eukprot:GSA120T00021463001.1
MYSKIAEQYGAAAGSLQRELSELQGTNQHKNLHRNVPFSRDQEDRLSNLQEKLVAMQPRRYPRRKVPWHQKVGTGDLDGVSTSFSVTDVGSVCASAVSNWDASGWVPVASTTVSGTTGGDYQHRPALAPLKTAHQHLLNKLATSSSGAALHQTTNAAANKLNRLAIDDKLLPGPLLQMDVNNQTRKLSTRAGGAGGQASASPAAVLSGGRINAPEPGTGPLHSDRPALQQIPPAAPRFNHNTGSKSSDVGAAANTRDITDQDDRIVEELMATASNVNVGGGTDDKHTEHDYFDGPIRPAGSLCGREDKGRKKLVSRREQKKREQQLHNSYAGPGRGFDALEVVDKENYRPSSATALLRNKAVAPPVERKVPGRKGPGGASASGAHAGPSFFNANKKQVGESERQHDERLSQIRGNTNSSTNFGAAQPQQRGENNNNSNPAYDAYARMQQMQRDHDIAQYLLLQMNGKGSRTGSPAENEDAGTLNNQSTTAAIALVPPPPSAPLKPKRSLDQELKLWESRVLEEKRKRVEAETELKRMRQLWYAQGGGEIEIPSDSG